MGEGNPSRRPDTASSPDAVSTPGTMDTHDGDATSTHGANTNLDPGLQGGPATASDRAATSEIEEHHEHREAGDT
jgi:hypothetical protein